jgi:glycosyltransferase involved in cell wall biosynthesis
MQERYGARRLPLCILNVPEYTPPCRTDLLHRYLRQQGVAAARPKIVVYVGVVTPARCAEEIVEAARLLPDDTVIVLIGPCEEGYDIEGAIRARGVERRVFYYGRVPSVADLEPLTNSADLGLQLQHNCGLNTYYCAPCKLFQYMMAGLPVVASNFPGMIEVVEKNLVGICVDPTDPKAIADAINTILSNEELRATMAANALRLSKERFCYEVEGTKLLDAIDGLVSAARL